jgi:hypothetical protein
MDNKEGILNEHPKVSPKGSFVNVQSRRYAGANVLTSSKLNDSQTRPLSSRGKKQRQKSKLAPRG